MSDDKTGRLAGKVVLVTGGASGIGVATVALCEREGAEVIALTTGNMFLAHSPATKSVSWSATILSPLPPATTNTPSISPAGSAASLVAASTAAVSHASSEVERRLA